jgi:K+-transporting ATPase ATPase A chain
MAFLFLAGVTTAYWSESRGNPLLTTAGADQSVTALSYGGNMEGKECRFGIANSALFATVTTDASCGAINSWHDSFTPLGGLVPLTNIMLGEVIFGGVGAGMTCGAEGAGATAAVVAGRFGHPTRKRVRARRGTTRNA